MRKFHRLLLIAVSLFIGALAAQCTQKPAPAPAPAAAAPSASNQALLGDMKGIVSVKELMQYMLDPVADNIFDAVGTDISKKGRVDHRPETVDDWEYVRTGAISLMEGVYLLKVPRPFAPPGDVNNSVGPNAPELSPTQIQAKLDADPVLWNAKIEALRNVALEVRAIVDHVGSKPVLFPNPFELNHGPKMGTQKDVDDLFQASEDLDEACESCHLEYWYPGDKADVEKTKKERSGFGKPMRGPLPVYPNYPKSTIVPTPKAEEKK